MKFCPNCGTQLQDGVKFCTECGTKVAVAAPPVPEPPAQPVFTPPVQQASPAPEVKTVPETSQAPEASKQPKSGKKKLLPILLGAAVLVVLLIVLLVSCGKGKAEDANLGIYQGVSCLYGDLDLGAEGEWIELQKKDKAVLCIMETEHPADWSLDGETITFRQNGEELVGTLKEGVLVIDFGGMVYTFAKDGAKVPTAKPEKQEDQPEEQPTSDEVYDAGNVTVLVPGGWKAFPETDVFAEEEGAMDPDVVNVSKGGQTEVDLFSKPYVRINYYGPSIEMMKVEASWYENVKDLEPFTAGDHRWFGFTCESLGTPLAILWCEEGSIQYQASIFLGDGEEAISPEDEDVRAILASVQPSDPNAETVRTEYDGTYRLVGDTLEGEERYLVVRSYPDFLMMEAFSVMEGSTYSFWVEEFWPNADCVLGETTVHGRSQTFSLMSRGNEYSEMPMARTITLTADGIALQTEGNDAEVYVLDDSYAYHNSEEVLADWLSGMYALQSEPTLVGSWEFWDGWRTVHLWLEEDGGFHFFSKEPGLPVRVMDGAWGVDTGTGDIQVVTELAGDGQYPYTATWQWRLEDDGYLYLQDAESNILWESGNDVGFWPAEEPLALYLTQETAMGYARNEYELYGEYTDQYGTDYHYTYRLPQFLEDTGDLAEMNAEIMERFLPIIQDEEAAMEKQEFLTTEYVDWDTFVTEDIVALYVQSFSYMWEEHAVYYYDLRTNTRTDSRELLHRIGIGEDEFLEAVRDAAEACYIEAFAEVPEDEREDYGYYERLAWTVSDEAVNLDLPMFVDPTGNLCVYAKIGSIAGADHFWMPLYPFADFTGYADAVG